MAGGAHPVADAAGRRDDLHRQHQARSRDQPLLDGQLEPRVEATRVAHGGVAHREGLREHARGAQVRGAGRLVEAEARGEAVAVRREVIVGVDQAGNDGAAAGVDDLRVGGPGDRGARAGRADPVAVDDHRRVRDGSRAGPVDQGGAGQDADHGLRIIPGLRGEGLTPASSTSFASTVSALK